MVQSSNARGLTNSMFKFFFFLFFFFEGKKIKKRKKKERKRNKIGGGDDEGESFNISALGQREQELP